MIEELGHVSQPRPVKSTKLWSLRSPPEFDLAILDVKVRDELITPVAELIKAAGGRSFSQPPMVQAACRKDFEIFRRCQNPSSSRPSQQRSTV